MHEWPPKLFENLENSKKILKIVKKIERLKFSNFEIVNFSNFDFLNFFDSSSIRNFEFFEI